MDKNKFLEWIKEQVEEVKSNRSDDYFQADAWLALLSTLEYKTINGEFD